MLITWVETHKPIFLTMYFLWKAIASVFKIFWDWYIDWGLFRGTRRDNRILRDQMKFSPKFYYCAMFFDVVGHLSWLYTAMAYERIALLLAEGEITNVDFFGRVSLILWGEMLLNFMRRTIWVLIRVENEFFTSYEDFRDIITIPPIKKEE